VDQRVSGGIVTVGYDAGLAGHSRTCTIYSLGAAHTRICRQSNHLCANQSCRL